MNSAFLRVLALACVLLPLSSMAQMPMPMQMPMHDAPAPAPAPARQETARVQRSKPSADPITQRDPKEAVLPIPFGRLADGDTSAERRPVSPAPDVSDAGLQEQERADRRTGSADAPMPDLLAEAAGRERRTLQFFAEQATHNNPTIGEAEAEVRRWRAEAKQAALWQNPEIGYEADHVRGGSYAGGEQGGYVQQTIPLAGQRSSARAALEAKAKAAEILSNAQAERVQAAVQQAFYAALAAQQEIALRKRLAELAVDNTVAMRQYANVGQADAPDVLGSEIEREQAAMEFASAERAYLKAFAALASVSGDAGLPVSLLSGDLEKVPVLDEKSASAAAEASPMLRVANQQVAASNAAVRSARAQAGPMLTLKAGLQQDNEPLDSTLRRVGVVGIAQAGVTVPLWNRNQGGVAAAAARQVAAEADVARASLSLRRQAEQAMQDYANAIGQAKRYRDSLLPRAQRATDLYDAKYATMAAAYPQRLAAHRMLLQLQLEYTRQLAAAWQSAILLQNGLLQDGLAQPVSLSAQASSAGND